MLQKVQALVDKETHCSKDKIYLACHQVLMEQYPDLEIRWSKIFGFRWSHLYGNTEKVSLNPVKIRLNRDYGICIDNAYILTADELQNIIHNLKECFPDEPFL